MNDLLMSLSNLNQQNIGPQRRDPLLGKLDYQSINSSVTSWTDKSYSPKCNPLSLFTPYIDVSDNDSVKSGDSIKSAPFVGRGGFFLPGVHQQFQSGHGSQS